MQDFRDKVAVVTGGASGIGRAHGRSFRGGRHARSSSPTSRRRRSRRPSASSRDRGAEVLARARPTSRSPSEVEALADAAVERFGGVHVALQQRRRRRSAVPMWEHTLADWEWVLGVNLWGVIHGIRTFVPIMLQQSEPAHVVNTASLAGLTSNPFLGVYNVTKHAVVTLSETLAQELAMVGAPIKVSVLCPGFVQTKIADSDRNRPADARRRRGRAPAAPSSSR